MDPVIVVFQLIILVLSDIIHEVAHGYAALYQGDVTAKYEGRLTLNPLVHIDIIGSVLLPLALFIGNSPVLFGWAKPVPINPYNFKNQRYGEAIVSFAGPASNLVIAVIFGLLIRLANSFSVAQSTITIMSLIVLINLILAIFNLVPIPPLDGSKILFAFIPKQWSRIRQFFELNSMLLVVVFILFFGQIISPIVGLLFRLLTGISY